MPTDSLVRRTTYPSSLRGNARNVHAVIWMMLLVVVVLQSSQSFREKNLNTFFHFHSWLETFLHKRSHTSTSTVRSTMRLCTVAVLMSNTAAERARENNSRRNPTLLFFCYLYKSTLVGVVVVGYIILFTRRLKKNFFIIFFTKQWSR